MDRFDRLANNGFKVIKYYFSQKSLPDLKSTWPRAVAKRKHKLNLIPLAPILVYLKFSELKKFSEMIFPISSFSILS